MIRLDIDLKGNPYIKIEIPAGEDSVESKMIKEFVGKARTDGLKIKNLSSFDHSNDYAGIWIKGQEVKE